MKRRWVRRLALPRALRLITVTLARDRASPPRTEEDVHRAEHDGRLLHLQVARDVTDLASGHGPRLSVRVGVRSRERVRRPSTMEPGPGTRSAAPALSS